MTFKKNLFTMLTAVFLAVVGAWLIGIGTLEIISGLTLVIPTVVMALLIEDLFRKLLGERGKLTWQYFLGEMFVVGSTLTWFWASKSTTVKEMAIRLITTFLLGFCGMLWFNFKYKASVQSGEEREQAKWARFRTKVQASTKEDGFKILACCLRFRLVDNNLANPLDLDQALALYNRKLMTLEELMAEEDDGTGSLQIAQDAATNYIQALVRKLG